MCKLLFVTLPLAATLVAQIPGPGPMPPGPPPFQFPLALRLFLELTDAQVATIQQANTDFERLVALRQLRIAQVYQEIAEETAKDPLDPTALGLRYAEIESIRRFLEGERGRMRDRVRAMLTDPQRTRLRALEEALKLLPLYYEAAAVNLLAFPPGFGVPGGVIGGPAPGPTLP